MTSYAYKLNELLRYEVIKGQQEAIESKYFRNFRELGEQVKKIIHGFPKSLLQENFGVDDMEVYLGVALPDQLYSRFNSHFEQKLHQYGIIIGCSDAEYARYLEKAGITLLKTLESKDVLCVRNYVARGHDYLKNDKVNSEELIFFYMTIKIYKNENNNWNKPNLEEREIIKKEVIENLENEELDPTDKNHIKAVVDTVHLSTDFEKVKWHIDHK